ncbi:MAG TPA: hypothetical protein VLX68_05460 [Chitinivibrionales bacterium]|nr:hypothetical protein [Chitinivibrionales bacterium]
MRKNSSNVSLMFIAFMGIIIAVSAIDTAAWGGFRGGYYDHGFHHGFYHGYYGWGTRWPYWYDYGPIAPPFGTFVAYLPDGYATIIVGGVPYYYCGGYYFRPYSNGYVIVPEPAANPAAVTSPTKESSAQQVPEASSTSEPAKEEAKSGSKIASQPHSSVQDTATINIPNAKGGFTPVKLAKHNNGYIGPQGEFYAGHPTVEQLKALYGN